MKHPQWQVMGEMLSPPISVGRTFMMELVGF